MEYSIRKFTLADKLSVISLFNRNSDEDFIYEKWDEVNFNKTFINNPDFHDDLTLVATINNEIIGFGNGTYKERSGFITMIIVDKTTQKKGIGSSILKELERELITHGVNRIDCSFFNPIKLSWNVPNTLNHQHNNAPGVLYPSEAFDFFTKRGYNAVSKQNAYYLNLNEFYIPQEMIEKIDTLKSQGITYEYFDKTKHDYKDLFDKLGNKLWTEEITESVYGESPKPVLVPIFQNQAVGFAGPIYPQVNGRGYFAGIGIHPDFRTNGIGKALFFLLCRHELELGAKYMTLFTGEENPARRMYEAAGFKIVKSWYVLRKEGL